MEAAIENSFAEYSLFYMALLQKRPVNLRSLLIVATPYHVQVRMEVVIENSFAEYSLFYMALLQKRPIHLRSLLIVATPYHVQVRMEVVIENSFAEYSLFYCSFAKETYKFKRYHILKSQHYSYSIALCMYLNMYA